MAGLRRCQGIMGLIFGHKFRPRYDETAEMPGGWTADRVSTYALELLRKTARTYRGDVCERCGATRSHDDT